MSLVRIPGTNRAVNPAMVQEIRGVETQSRKFATVYLADGNTFDVDLPFGEVMALFNHGMDMQALIGGAMDAFRASLQRGDDWQMALVDLERTQFWLSLGRLV